MAVGTVKPQGESLKGPVMAETLVTTVLEAYASAVYDRDVDALMALYEPGARIFDAWGVWSYEDAAAWRVAVEGWLGSLGTERVKVTFEDVRAVAEHGFATVSAVVTYQGVDADGKVLRAMQNRLTWVLRVSGQALRIVHEHTSAPIGFEDSKAILQRAPANS
jgi:ketosteroid isomerase-like protein